MKFKKLELTEKENVYLLLKEASFGENGFSTGEVNRTAFQDYLKNRVDESNGIHIKPGRVPQTTYIFYTDNEPVGIVKFRRELSEYLLKRGGNIGYYVRKDVRGKGIGTEMLKNFLKVIIKETNLKKVLITCNDDNTASERVIISNGGKLENIIEGQKRFWIDL